MCTFSKRSYLEEYVITAGQKIHIANLRRPFMVGRREVIMSRPGEDDRR